MLQIGQNKTNEIPFPNGAAVFMQCSVSVARIPLWQTMYLLVFCVVAHHPLRKCKLHEDMTIFTNESINVGTRACGVCQGKELDFILQGHSAHEMIKQSIS